MMKVSRSRSMAASVAAGSKRERQMQRCAVIKRAEQNDAEPQHVRGRQYAIDAVRGAEIAQQARHFRDVKQIAMGQHHALGRAGCPRGVDHGRDLIGAACLDRLRHRRLIERAERDGAERLDGNGCGAVTRGMGAGARRYGGGVDDAARAGEIADLVELAVREAGIHDQRPGIEAGGAEQQRHGGAAILGDDHHPVAGPHAVCREPRPRRLDDGRQFAVTPSAATIDQGRALGGGRGPARRQHADALRQIGEQLIHIVRLRRPCAARATTPWRDRRHARASCCCDCPARCGR